MNKIKLVSVFLLIAIAAYADFVPQNLLFKSEQQISITQQYSDSLETDCEWFNSLSAQYRIDNLHYMFECALDKGSTYWYFISYKDSIDADSLVTLFMQDTKVVLAHPNYYGEFCSDPLQQYQWSLDKINMTDYWNSANNQYSGTNVNVGIVEYI